MLAVTVTLTVLVFLYLAVSACYVILFVVTYRSGGGTVSAQGKLIDLIYRHGGRVQRPASNYLRFPSTALAWPVVMRLSRTIGRSSSFVEATVKSQSRPFEPWIAAGNTLLLVVLSVLGLADVIWNPALVISAAVVLGSLVLRLLACVITSLPSQLRRSAFNPVVSFIATAACNGLTLALAITILGPWRHGAPRRPEAVGASLLDLLNVPGKITDLPGMTPGAVAVAGLALLYYYAILKAVFNPGEFKRTDEDVRTLASAALLSGNIAGAEQWISQEKGRSAASFRIRASVELARGRFGPAAQSVHRALRSAGEDDTDDNAVLLLSEQFFDLVTTRAVSPAITESFCVYLIGSTSQDGIVATYVESIVSFSADPPGLAARLLPVIPEAKRPITRAVMTHGANDTEGAIEILRRSLPGSELEEFLRLVLDRILWFSLFDKLYSPDDPSWAGWQTADRELVRNVGDWLASILPLVRDLARSVTTSAERAVVTLRLISLHGLFQMILEDDDLPWPDRDLAVREVHSMIEVAEEVAPSVTDFVRMRKLIEESMKVDVPG